MIIKWKNSFFPAILIVLAMLIEINSAIYNDSSNSNSSSIEQNEILNDAEITDLKLIQNWKDMLKSARSGIQSALKSALPTFIRLTSKATLSPECQGSFLNMIIGLSALKPWAVTMIDASGKIPSGMTRGTVADFGDYDLCLNITVMEKTERSDKVTGMYCSLVVGAKLPKTRQLDFVNMTGPNTLFASFQDKVRYFDQLKFRSGLCVPSTCTKEDIESLLSSVIDEYPFEVEVPQCEVIKDNELTWHQLTVLSCFGLLLITLILGTGVDLILPVSTKNSGIFALLLNFSLYKNGKILLKTEVKATKLRALNGIKVLCVIWILLIHCYSHALRFAMYRALNIFELSKQYPFGTIINSFCSVDTFFVISGLLVSYLTMMYMEKSKGRLNIFAFYLRRWLRLTPSLLAVIGIVMLFPLMGSGPLWKEVVTREVDVCKESWWANILFINNWFDYFNMCLVHTWYICDDVHYYMLSPFLMFIFYKRPKLGIFITCAIILGSIGTSGFMVWYHNTNIFFPANTEEFLNYKVWLHTNYFKTYSHLSTYFVGFLLGYLMFRRSEIKLKPIYVLLGWILSTVIALSVLLGVHPWLNGEIPSLTEAIVYRSLYRTGWAVSISWVIFACCYGHAGYVNTLLSWKIFVPLNRLVYMLYLTQMPVQWIRLGSKKHIVPMDHIEIIYDFFGNLVVTLLVSIVGYLAIEAPFASLSDSLLTGLMRKTRRLSNAVLEKVTTSDNAIIASIRRASLEKSTIPQDKEQVANIRYPPHPNMLRQRTRSTDDITGKLSSTILSTVSPESEPTTEMEDQVKRKEEIIKMYKEMKSDFTKM